MKIFSHVNMCAKSWILELNLKKNPQKQCYIFKQKPPERHPQTWKIPANETSLNPTEHVAGPDHEQRSSPPTKNGKPRKPSWLATNFDGPDTLPECQTSAHPNKFYSRTSHLAKDHVEPPVFNSMIGAKALYWARKLIRPNGRRKLQNEPIGEKQSKKKTKNAPFKNIKR